MATQFVPGWAPHYAAAAASSLMASGRYCVPAVPTKPLPPAWSLTQYRISSYDQGNAGTCWLHSPKQMAEVSARALGYDAFPVCRRLIGWYAKQEFEGGDNPTEGGSPTDALRAMTAKGAGLAHEDLCPYSDDPRVLGTKPDPDVWADGLKSHILAPVLIRGLDDAKHRMVAGWGTANGVPWPGNWEESRTFHSQIGPIVGGHSVLMLGFASPGVFDRYAWLQFDNWREPQYPALPPELAAKVPGYKPTTPTMTTDLWVREDVYLNLCRKEVVEHISATDFDGLTRGIVNRPASFDEGFV